MFERSVTDRYNDPVDLIWSRAANDLGLTIQRSADAFAAYDGKGTLTIAEASHFDADDCLAQMIFHEICHWLVAGKRGNLLEDWGLSNIDDRDLVYEYAAHRVQAALSHPFGLRDFMAVTTDWRPYWDALPDNPLLADDDPATPIAREAFYLARSEPFQSVLDRSSCCDCGDRGCRSSNCRRGFALENHSSASSLRRFAVRVGSGILWWLCLGYGGRARGFVGW